MVCGSFFGSLRKGYVHMPQNAEEMKQKEQSSKKAEEAADNRSRMKEIRQVL